MSSAGCPATVRKAVWSAESVKAILEAAEFRRGGGGLEHSEKPRQPGEWVPEALVASTQWTPMPAETRSKGLAGRWTDESTTDKVPESGLAVQGGDIGREQRVYRCADCDRGFRDNTTLVVGAAGHRAPRTTEAQTTATTAADFDILEEVMHGGGDLIVETATEDGKKLGYRVGSQILCAASPVFRAMLGCGTLPEEAVNVRQPAAIGELLPAVIKLEGDVEALGRVLRVLHYRYDLTNEDISFTQFVKIAEICHRYELRGPLQPLADSLTESPDLQHNVGEIGYEDCVLVSYVFGYEELFANSTVHDVIMRRSNEGLLSDQNRRLSASTPSGVIEQLKFELHARLNAP
ncbi:hypothetical protein BZA05DRAFT_169294 [Tricharina praecox]|uniref:uncharacterized protein n=1 Tax=Tricharina praecox TaxID=43433 RepID=UPI002220782B|nr:uncharacterized protein BZA05DRAFT_169294 [Tricharina praecox]KAI5857241.1 hypothetical protein BZA05DRAFT_169294 [Tricharina praecox]